MTVYWTDPALEDLQAILDYATDGGLAKQASKLISDLMNRASTLAAYPRSGRRVPEYDDETIRELIEAPYRIIYRLNPTDIDILAVVHSARILPHRMH